MSTPPNGGMSPNAIFGLKLAAIIGGSLVAFIASGLIIRHTLGDAGLGPIYAGLVVGGLLARLAHWGGTFLKPPEPTA